MSLTTEGFGSKSYFYADYIFKNTALANAGTVTSSEFEFGGSMAGTEVVVVADTEIVVASAQTITYTIVTADASGGSFDKTEVTKVFTAGTIAAGTELLRYASNTETEVYAKLVAVTTADQSADKHTATIRLISK